MKTLHKISLFVAIISLLFTFSACKKDGVYNPSKKIAAVYEEVDDNPTPSYKAATKELLATYVWDGNLLSKIIFHDEEETTTYTYIYNKKQLIEVNMGTDGELKVEYDGNNVQRIHFSLNGTEMLTVEYIRNGKQISGADVEVSTDLLEDFLKKKHTPVIKDMLQTFLPYQMDIAFAQSAQQFAQNYATDSKGASLKGHIDYEWNGKNISKADFSLSFIIYSVQIVSIYEFDNNNNPFSGGMLASGESVDEDILAMFHGWMNVNNITKSTISLYAEGENDTDVITRTYEYDNDKYPVKVTTKDIDGNIEDVLYYEYGE